MGRPRTDKKYEHLTVRFPEGMLDILREHGSTYHMSLNAEILSAVEERVAAIAKAQRARETGKTRRPVLSTV
jgi:hypothetical protein